MAVEILHGVAPSAIPLREHGNIRLIIDDSVADRWNIPRSLLPRDADIIGETGGWRALRSADRRLLWAGGILVVLQMLTILVLIVNILRRRKAERELQESREMLDRAQRTAHIGLWSRDPGTGKLFWSEEVYRMFGLDPGSVTPSFEKFLSFVHPADRQRVEAIVRASDSRRQSRLLEFRVQLPGGGERHVRSTGEWITGPDGRPRVAGMVQDITELKQTEELLQQMQRMESVGTLAGGVAHDFNNLLTVINGYSQMLAGALAPDDPRSQQVREIQRAGERAAELTRQLLAFSRKQILSPRLFDLNHLLRESEGLLKPVVGDRVQIEFDLAPSLCLVHADPWQIEQVLINLAANARDAMPRGGCLRIRTALLLMKEFSDIAEETILPGRYVELLVSDDGCGMDEETRRRVFEPFFTTKPEGKGTGLGLATVYGIVRQSGGWITVNSEPGAGTAFRILLPSAEGALPPQEEQRGNPAGAECSRVLVLDHHPQTGELISLALRQAGYKVEFAPDEQRLLRMVETAPEEDPFHVLLVDLRMPHISGFDLVRRLRRRHPHLRALMLFAASAKAHPGDLEQGEAILDAPVTPAALTAALRSLLAEPAAG
jgi:PAS domain S-box-containing protein